MEFVRSIISCWGGLPVLFVFSIVVFVHELGHFLVARWCGIRVLVFSIGFGPELLGFNDRHGTRWKLAAIPLGGYVKFLGDDNAASVPDQAAIAQMSETDRLESFPAKGIGARSAVVAAGPIANFLMAIVIFAGLAMVFGKPSTAARVDICSRAALPKRPAFTLAISCCPSTAGASTISPRCSGSSA